jgi:hypothetical protein
VFGNRFFSVAALVGIAIVHSAARGDEPVDTEAAAGRQQRLEYLKTRAGEFQVFTEADREKPLAQTKEPLLRYSNPARGFLLSDGGTFLWLDGERVVAVASWSLRGTGKCYREFTSLAAEPLICMNGARVVWSPKAGGLVDQLLPDAPVPLANAPRRLAQMRTLAARFSAVIFKDDAPTELRLMSQPVHRYKRESDKILDGGLFSFAEATDPEALVLLEARRGTKAGEFEWRFTLARMTSSQLRMRLDDKEIWSVTNFWKSPKSPDDPYVEAFAGDYVAPESPAPEK